MPVREREEVQEVSRAGVREDPAGAANVVTLVTQLEAGGAQLAAVRVSEGLRCQGMASETWFLYRKREAFVGHEGIRVVLDHPPRGLRDYLVIVWRLFMMLRTAAPKAVITFTHYANVLGLSAALAANVPIRVASHRNPRWTYPGAVRLLDSLFGILGVYSRIVAVSETTAETFRTLPRRYHRRIVVVPNGVAAPSGDGSGVRCRYRIPDDHLFALAVGRLAYQKNHEILLRALARVERVSLVIAGEGELRDHLERIAREFGLENRVHFAGEVGKQVVADMMLAADFFLMPSRFEGLSNALLEALAAGLPVVVSDIPAQTEVLDVSGELSVGLRVPPDDLDGWISAIKAMADAPRRADYAARAVKRSRDYSIQSMVQGFADAVGIGANK